MVTGKRPEEHLQRSNESIETKTETRQKRQKKENTKKEIYFKKNARKDISTIRKHIFRQDDMVENFNI